MSCLACLVETSKRSFSRAYRKNCVRFIHTDHHIVIGGVAFFLKFNDSRSKRRNVRPKSVARSVRLKFVG